MIKKEWREVGKHSLYFVLAMAGMVLLVGLIGSLEGKSLEGEKIIIIMGLWLLMFSLFLGLSPFAMDSKQKGLEYLLSLPYSRRRLLFIKLLPRLAAACLFYLVFVFLYRHMGSDAFGGYFAFFSLTYFALFFISFSLSVIHDNFIVQSLWAGIALCGYLALCLYVVLLGFSWKFEMPASWVGSSLMQDLSYDLSTLLSSVAVFLLLAAPFVLSFYLAFKKFDLKPTMAFNRRHLLLFVPMLLIALAASLGVTYLVQNSSPYWESELFVLADQRLLKADFPGKLTLCDGSGQRQVDTKSAVFWERLLLEKGERLYLSGYDTRDGAPIIGFLNQDDLSWKIVHRAPERGFIVGGTMGILYDGEQFVYLRRYPSEAEEPGTGGDSLTGSGVLELVRVDLVGGGSRMIRFRSPFFRTRYEPRFIGSDQRGGQRFWLIAYQWHNVLRLWADGLVEDLGASNGFPAYAGGLLFTRGDHALQVRRLLDAGSEKVREIEGKFSLVNPYRLSLGNNPMGEIYAERDKRIVRIDLATLDVSDIGPYRGHIWLVPPGNFYYVEYETWPGMLTDTWKRLYRLQGGKMALLKQFDFNDAGYGHVFVDTCGVILRQVKMKNARVAKASTRAFAFPDLRELKFRKVN